MADLPAFRTMMGDLSFSEGAANEIYQNQGDNLNLTSLQLHALTFLSLGPFHWMEILKRLDDFDHLAK